MDRKRRRNFSAEEKVSILREALVDKVAVSSVCEKHRLQPSQFYTWQKDLFENGALAFAGKRGPKVDRSSEKIEALKERHSACSSTPHIALNASLG